MQTAGGCPTFSIEKAGLGVHPRRSPSEKGPSHFGLSGPYQMELGLEAFTVRRMLVMRLCRAPHACQPEAQIVCDLMAVRPTRALRTVPGRRWGLCTGCRRCTTVLQQDLIASLFSASLPDGMAVGP